MDQNSSFDEVAPQDQESNVVVEDGQSTEAPIEVANHESDDKQEKNWREIRRKQREADIQLKAKDELIEKLLKAQKSQEAEQKPVEVDEFADIDGEDYPTWSQTDKRIEKRAAAIAEKKYREMQANQEREKWRERLKDEYSDFNDVVNPDTIALLEETKPKLAQSIALQKDPYMMGLQTYHYLKTLNLGEQVPEMRRTKEVEKRLEENNNTVQSPQAYNKRPMAQAVKYTKSDRTNLYEEMQRSALKAGGGY